MTDDEIIELAKQAGFEEHQAKFDARFEPFAKLVAEKEREAFAKLIAKLTEMLEINGPKVTEVTKENGNDRRRSN